MRYHHFFAPARCRQVSLAGVLALLVVAGGIPPLNAAETVPASGPLAASLGALPMSFEPNVGQFDDDVSFYVRGAGCSIVVSPTGARLLFSPKHRRDSVADQARGSAARRHGRSVPPAAASREVQLQLVGARPQAGGVGEEPLPGIVNYLLGNDPGAWKTGIETFARARFARVYSGIDLVYYGNQSQLEYDFIVAPHAQPGLIRLRFTGADDVTLDASGDLLLHLDGKFIRWQKPVAFQSISGERREVEVSYRLLANGELAFDLGAYDAAQELVIDPLLVYSTYLGGTDLDSIQSATVDNWGNIYFAGVTYSTNFPVFRAYRTNPYAYADAFVTKLNSNATALVFSTYFGGSSNDWANAVAVDSGSNVFIAGYTDSLNLPTRNAFKNSVGEYGDAFLARFGPYGSNLVYSTYFGDGSGNFPDYEEAFALAVNNSGHAWIAGATASGSAFSSKAPIQNGFGGGFQDAMVARFDTTQSGAGSQVWASWLGGNYSDVAYGIAVDTNNNCYVVGTMLAEYDDFGEILPASFPVLNAYQPGYGGGFNDAFLVKIDSGGNPARVFATFLGGSSEDSAYGVTVDGAGQAYVCGETSSENFPVVNGLQAYQADGGFFSDAFVSKFNAAGSALAYSTYLGGTRSEGARSVLVDRFGHIYLAGYTQSGNLPVTPDAVQSALGGTVGVDTDMFAAKINPAIPGPSGLIFGTYYGGSDLEVSAGDYDFWSLFAPANLGVGLGLDSALNFYLASDTFSTNLPAAGGATYKTSPIGGGDVFAAKIASPVDISAAMVASADPVIAGSNLVYTVYVNNNGLSTFNNAIVTAVLPAKLQFLSATNSPGVVSNVGNTVYLAYGNLTNNAARQSTIVTRALAPGVITNTINLTATPLDAHTNNNRASIVTTIRGVANLALSISASPNPGLATSNVTFILTVTNNGPWPASSIVLTNPLPAGATFVSATAEPFRPTAFAGGLVYCFIGGLESNGVTRVTNVFRMDAAPASLNCAAGFYFYEFDPVLANNSASASVPIDPVTDVLIGSSTNTFSGPSLLVGSNFTYRVYVTNNGPSSASSVFVTNVIPPGVSYVSASATRGSVTQYLGVVTWNVTSLSSNQSANLGVVMKPNYVGYLTNSAVIVSSASDPHPANNTSQAVSAIAPISDLALTMTAPPGPVIVTSNIVYSLLISNAGPYTATNIVLANPLPPQAALVSVEVNRGTTRLVGSTLFLDIAALNPNVTATLVLTLKPLIEGSLTNTAFVSSGVADPFPANSSASVSILVTNHPDGPILRIARIGSTTNVLLYWTTNSAGYFLESTTNLISGVNWVSNTTLPVIRGTQYQLTNSTTPVPRHYRLKKNPPPVAPLLSLRLASPNVELFWPTNSPGYALQATLAISPASWIYISNSPIITAGQYMVALPYTSTWRFFRLRK